MESVKNPETLQLYRQRVIPSEYFHLKDDRILVCEGDTLITSWEVLNPKIEFNHGCSLYLLDKGFKISQFFRPDNSLLYWYCDIVTSSYDPAENHLVVKDLLADVLLYPDGTMHVVDLDELSDAFEQNLITQEELLLSLRRLNDLLTRIQAGQFPSLIEKLTALSPVSNVRFPETK